MKSGMTSVTFRNKSIKEIVHIAKKAGLDVIEWGGDVHCPPDNKEALREAYEETEKAGLEVSSYGSYFRLGVTDISEFHKICEAANILKTDTVRIWAYDKDAKDVSSEEYASCVMLARKISDIAEGYGITVCFEYHRGTLTVNAESAVKLINDIGNNNMRLYWQPNPDITHEENCKELQKVLPYVVNIHCFNWVNTPQKSNFRLPLEKGKTEWERYLNIAKDTARNIILEFTAEDNDDNFTNDARTLISLL